MDSRDFFKFIEEDIHSVVMATVDNNGLPVTCAVNIMSSDAQGLYFLTAKGKGFYDRLKRNGYISLTGLKGENTLSCVAVSFRGKVCEIGNSRINEMFKKNPYMNEIYPTKQSRQALTVFHIYEGSGEWFDLSKKPIERFSFAIGGEDKADNCYVITNNCIGCEACKAVCPQNCIDFTNVPAIISQKNCLHCGNCLSVCPNNAVVRR